MTISFLFLFTDAVINLFLDWHKFKGVNSKPKLTSFLDTLKNHYDYQSIVAYFSL